MDPVVSFHSDLADDGNPQGVHFGFVYFSDQTRVGYTDEGVDKDATGPWPPVTDEHVRLATEYLEGQNLLGTRTTAE